MGEIIPFHTLFGRLDLIGKRVLCLEDKTGTPGIYGVGNTYLVEFWQCEHDLNDTGAVVKKSFSGCGARWEVLEGEELKTEDFV